MTRPLPTLARMLPAVGRALALAAALSCASAPEVVDADPAQAYLERVRARLLMAREQPSYTLRFNPAACDCPPFEIALGGIWQRVVFAGAGPDDETIMALEAAVAAARAGGSATTWQVQGSLDDALTTCARGALVVALAPTAFGVPPAQEEP